MWIALIMLTLHRAFKQVQQRKLTFMRIKRTQTLRNSITFQAANIIHLLRSRILRQTLFTIITTMKQKSTKGKAKITRVWGMNIKIQATTAKKIQIWHLSNKEKENLTRFLKGPKVKMLKSSIPWKHTSHNLHLKLKNPILFLSTLCIRKYMEARDQTRQVKLNKIMESILNELSLLKIEESLLEKPILKSNKIEETLKRVLHNRK